MMNVKTYFQVKEKYRNVFPLFMRNKIREILFIYFCISTLRGGEEKNELFII